MVETSGEWKLENTDRGIRSYSLASRVSNLFQFRAITIIDAPLYVVGTVVRDLPAYPQWMAACKQARVIESVDENNFTAHVTLAFPVVSDRDVVFRATTEIDLTRARSSVTLALVSDAGVPIARGIVRMPAFSGSYLFEYLSPVKTGVIYTYRADPGGNIPSLVSNWFSKNLLVETLKKLKTMVKRPSYRASAEGSNDKAMWDETLKDKDKVRLVIKNRLKEHFQDHGSIDQLISRIDLEAHFLSSSKGLAEMLFDAGCAPSNPRRAAQLLLRLCLEGLTDDRAKVESLSSDPALVDTLLRGPRSGQPAVCEILGAHFPPPEPPKKNPAKRSAGRKKPAEPGTARRAKK